jgi:hypothetical protein
MTESLVEAEVVVPETKRGPRQCTAKSKRSQKTCRRWAMKGQRTCMMHGGKTPIALEKAQLAIEMADMRLRGLTGNAVDALEKLLDASSESVVLGAARDVLDRGGLKAADRLEVSASIIVKRPW